MRKSGEIKRETVTFVERYICATVTICEHRGLAAAGGPTYRRRHVPRVFREKKNSLVSPRSISSMRLVDMRSPSLLCPSGNHIEEPAVESYWRTALRTTKAIY